MGGEVSGSQIEQLVDELICLRTSSPLTCRACLLRELAEGHRLDSRQRESSINELLKAETEILRCP
jgi:hypothetical protein